MNPLNLVIAAASLMVAVTALPQVQVWKDAGYQGDSVIISSKVNECGLYSFSL